jgi:hypothetical protein
LLTGQSLDDVNNGKEAQKNAGIRVFPRLPVAPVLARPANGAILGPSQPGDAHMRIVLVALVTLAAGCSKEATTTNGADSTPAAVTVEAEPAAPAAPAAVDLWPEGFPKPTVDYSGVYEFGAAGKTTDVLIAASGVKQRMAFPPGSGIGGAQGQWSQIIVNENSGENMLMWPEGEGAPKIATKMSKSDLGAMASAFGADPAEQARAVKTGSDKIAGENCGIYEIAKSGDDATPGSACVTRDGILLRAVSGGQTVMQAKSIERGRQDPQQFAPPEGYEVVDMGECMRIGAEMMAAARAGKTPDMAKMEKCKALGEKMGAMYGNQ